MQHCYTVVFLFCSLLSYTQVSGDFEGEIKSTSLSGTGNRNVIADQNGVLKIGPSLNSLPANPSSGDIIYFNGTAWQTLPIGTQGQTLTSCNNVLTWGPCPAVSISSHSAIQITDTSATISWTASENVQGYVEYGTTVTYGQQTNGEFSFNNASHQQLIAGLQSGTTYYYRIHSTAQSGEQVTATGSFTTTGGAPVCTGLFDCARSQASFVITLNGQPAPMPLQYGVEYAIQNEWVDCDGIRVQSPIKGMQIEGANQVANFQGSNGLVNNYLITPQFQVNGQITFCWGKGTDLCSKTFPYAYDPPVNSVEWPVYDGSNASCIEANTTGETKTFNYNGKQIDVTNLDNNSSTNYAKRVTITRDGGNGELVLLNGVEVRNLETKQLVGNLPMPGSTSRASWFEPDVFYGFKNNKLIKYNVITDTETPLTDLSSINSGGTWTIGEHEGNFSKDMKRVIAMNSNDIVSIDYGLSSDGSPVQLQLQDVLDDAQSVYGDTFDRIDWISVSFSGNYILALVKHPTESIKNTLVLYDWGFTNPRSVGDPRTRGSHGCFLNDVNGKEAFGFVHWNDLLMFHLDNPDDLYAMGWGQHGHMSGRPDNNYFVASSTGGNTSSAYIGEFDPSKYNTAGTKSSKDFAYLGRTWEPTSPTVKRLIGCFENVGDEYPGGCQAEMSFNDKAVLTGRNSSTSYSMCAEVK